MPPVAHTGPFSGRPSSSARSPSARSPSARSPRAASSSNIPPSFPHGQYHTPPSLKDSTYPPPTFSLPPGFKLVPYSFSPGPTFPAHRGPLLSHHEGVPASRSGGSTGEGSPVPGHALPRVLHARGSTSFEASHAGDRNLLAEDNPLAIVPYTPQPRSPVLTVSLRPAMPIASAEFPGLLPSMYDPFEPQQQQHRTPSGLPSLPPPSPGKNPWDDSDDEDDGETPQSKRKNFEFNVYVTMRFAETTQLPSGKQRVKSAKLTQTVQANVLQMSRSQFIKMFLAEHEAADLYKITADGPPFSVALGSTSKGTASSVRNDKQFMAAVKPLLASRVTNVSVEFDTANWKAWLTTLANVTGSAVPAGAQVAIQNTAVASQSFFSSKEGEVAKMMMHLREKFWCTRHDEACFRDLNNPNAPHHLMPNGPLKILAQDVVHKRCTEDSPSATLLKVMKLVTARGRAEEAVPSSSKRRRSASPPQRSSPPPGALDDHLQVALNACAEQHAHISVAELKAAYNALSTKGYVPHSFVSLTVEKVAELTGLPEGKATTLHAFCVTWAGNMDRKWKKRRNA